MSRTNSFKYNADLLSRASFSATLEDKALPCIVEVTVYRLNAVAVTSYKLDGDEPLLHFLGLTEADTYVTRHEIDDIVTVVHIIRKEPKA